MPHTPQPCPKRCVSLFLLLALWPGSRVRLGRSRGRSRDPPLLQGDGRHGRARRGGVRVPPGGGHGAVLRVVQGASRKDAAPRAEPRWHLVGTRRYRRFRRGRLMDTLRRAALEVPAIEAVDENRLVATTRRLDAKEGLAPWRSSAVRAQLPRL